LPRCNCSNYSPPVSRPRARGRVGKGELAPQPSSLPSLPSFPSFASLASLASLPSFRPKRRNLLPCGNLRPSRSSFGSLRWTSESGRAGLKTPRYPPEVPPGRRTDTISCSLPAGLPDRRLGFESQTAARTDGVRRMTEGSSSMKDPLPNPPPCAGAGDDGSARPTAPRATEVFEAPLALVSEPACSPLPGLGEGLGGEGFYGSPSPQLK